MYLRAALLILRFSFKHIADALAHRADVVGGESLDASINLLRHVETTQRGPVNKRNGPKWAQHLGKQVIADADNWSLEPMRRGRRCTTAGYFKIDMIIRNVDNITNRVTVGCT